VDRGDSVLITVPCKNSSRRDAHFSSLKFHSVSGTVFRNKWGVSDLEWGPVHHALRNSLIPNYIMYPYFEKDVEGLREKNYVVPDEKWSIKTPGLDFFTVE
jgi:hypothetical protein